MEIIVAAGIGLLTAVGLYLMLRGTTFPVILGLTFLSYAVNVFLFAMGRLAVDRPPIYVPGVKDYTDPLPQALVLTAIVISFGMTALIVVLAMRGFLESGSDAVDLDRGDAQVEPDEPDPVPPAAPAAEARP
jgi:multicomponent K+:H+ antiporter subunit C